MLRSGRDPKHVGQGAGRPKAPSSINDILGWPQRASWRTAITFRLALHSNANVGFFPAMFQQCYSVHSLWQFAWLHIARNIVVFQIYVSPTLLQLIGEHHSTSGLVHFSQHNTSSSSQVFLLPTHSQHVVKVCSPFAAIFNVDAGIFVDRLPVELVAVCDVSPGGDFAYHHVDYTVRGVITV